MQCLWVRMREPQPSRLSPALCKTDVSKEQILEADFTQDASTFVFRFVLGVHFKSHSPSWLHSLCFGSHPQAVLMHSGCHRNDTERCASIARHQAAQPRDQHGTSPRCTEVGSGGLHAISLL